MVRRIGLLLLVLAMMAPALYADEWVGYITDEHCGAKGAKADHGSCALSCAGRGAALVFYNEANKELYKLDDQEAAKRMAGHKVKVTGTMEEGTIKVTSIVEAEEGE